jgi:hypothetical protein
MCVFRRQEQNTGWKHICGWFRRLTVEEKQALNQRVWDEGRLKLEPWLKPRIDHDPIKIWPTSQKVLFLGYSSPVWRRRKTSEPFLRSR